MGRAPGWGAAATGRPAMRSPGRPPIGRDEHHRLFWSAIARGVTSTDAGVEAGVSPVVGTRWFRERGGVIPQSVFTVESGRYLSFAEREQIALWRAEKLGVREIARRLGRDFKGVHSDASLLVDSGVVEKDASGKLIFPYDRIHVDFEIPAAA